MQILLSIKPEYVSRIFSGEKRFEFRKSIFKYDGVSEIYVYATSPVKKIVGKFSIKHIHKGTPRNIWKVGRKYAGIDKEKFFEYFDGKDTAYAIEIADVVQFKQPLNPNLVLNNFVAPQSFRYINQELIQEYADTGVQNLT